MRQARAVLALKRLKTKITALNFFFILYQFHVRLGRQAFIFALLWQRNPLCFEQDAIAVHKICLPQDLS
jgi:hypothetical protein